MVRRNTDVNRYMMRQNLVSIGDDFYIENERGERVFHVGGNRLTIRTFDFHRVFDMHQFFLDLA